MLQNSLRLNQQWWERPAAFPDSWEAFAPWHDEVYFYLCMEKPEIWKRLFGRVYADNEEFEATMIDRIFAKLAAHSGSR